MEQPKLPREVVASQVQNLFFSGTKNITEMIGQFVEATLATKRPDSAFLSNYRAFTYAEELKKIDFPYHPRPILDFIEDYRNFFANVVNFDAPGTMYNVHPNVNVPGQVASFVASIANPNLCMDIPAGRMLLLEKAVANYFAQLAGWDGERARGVFTFGGKGTLLYALKMALTAADADHRDRGVNGRSVIVSNELGHPSHIEICNWAGLGQQSCVRLKTVDGTVDLEGLRAILERSATEGRRVPLIILNGMTTNNHTFDPVKEVADIRDAFVARRGLDYRPWIHVDSVLGWVYLLAGRYEYEKNPLELEDFVMEEMMSKARAASEFRYADSFAADFHKTGFCAYSSSLLMVRNQSDLFAIQGHYDEQADLAFTEYAPYDYTLESSRSPHGPASAYATLQTLGVEGFVHILANQTAAFKRLKELFGALPTAVVGNLNESSNLVFVAFLPNAVMKGDVHDGMDASTAESIRRFNFGFHGFLMKKATSGRLPVYFSVSRSYKYGGQSLGFLKLYSFNSTLDRSTSESVFRSIHQLVTEYREFEGDVPESKSFDFTREPTVRDV